MHCISQLGLNRRSAKQPRISGKKLKIFSVHVEFGKLLVIDMLLAIK